MNRAPAEQRHRADAYALVARPQGELDAYLLCSYSRGMGLDFTQLGKASAADTSTEPRSIFNALPKRSSKYSYPRAGQTEVWERWHICRNESDVVVKMNTGAGKTVVGLLVLKSSLNEGVGPVVYVTPDNYLRDQVRAEADEVGLETTDDPQSPRFQQSKAILVVSI